MPSHQYTDFNFLILNYFSSSDTLHDLKAKIAAMNANASFPDSFQWKNLATGKMINPDDLCAGIFHLLFAFSIEQACLDL